MGCPNWDFFFASWQVEHPTGCSQVLGVPHSRVFYSPQTHRGGRGHQVFQIPKTVKDMEVVSHTFAGLVCLRVFLKAAGAIDCCHIYIKPLRAHHLTGGLWPSGLYWRVPDQPQVSVRVQTAPPQPTVQAVSLPSSRAFYLGRWSVPMTPMSITPHHSLQKASTSCGSPARQQPIFQGTFYYEDQILSHLPASAGGHNSICFFCFRAGDIMAPQNEPEKYAGVVERMAGLEAVRGSLCQSKLSAVLEEVHQNTTTFNRQAKKFKYRFLLCFFLVLC